MKAMMMTGAIALAGCAAAPPPATDPASTVVACDAARVQDVVGRPLADVQADAQARSGARIVRAYGPRAMLTKDYRIERLNIETDAAGVVVKVGCG